MPMAIALGVGTGLAPYRGGSSVLPAAVKVVYAGDSIELGQNSVFPNRPPDVAQTYLPAGPTYTYAVTAVGGKKTWDLYTEFGTVIGPAFDASKTCYLHLGVGVNDLANTNRITSNYYLPRLIAKALKIGYAGVVVSTLISPNYGSPPDASFDASTLQYNIDIITRRAQYGIVAIADAANNAAFDTALDANVAPPYHSDKLHLVDAGSAILGGIIGQALSAAILTPLPTPVTPAWSDLDGRNTPVNLSNGNRTLVGGIGGGMGNARGAFFKWSGKWAWETVLNNWQDAVVGLCGIDYNTASTTISIATNAAIGCFAGKITLNSVDKGTIATFTNGMVIQHHLDAAAKLYWVRAAGGLWNGSGTADPATGVGGIDVSSFGPIYTPLAQGYHPNSLITSNFTAAQLVSAPATGFTAIGA